MKRRSITAEEHDVHSGWRRVMTRYRRAGAAAKAKRRSRRRERREGREEVRRGDQEG